MPAFTQDVFDATKEKPITGEYEKYNELLQKRAKAAQEQYGGWGTYKATPQMSDVDRLRAEREYKGTEYGRRQQAAQQKFGLAQSIETSRGGIADRVRAALTGREGLKQDVWDQQKRMEQESGLAQQEQALQFRTQMGKMNFASFQTAAERIDAMQQAYAKGTLNFQMLDAARNNMLTMVDIDKYFAILKNNFANALEDLKTEGQVKLDAAKSLFEADSRNTGSIISGLFDIASVAMKSYASKGS